MAAVSDTKAHHHNFIVQIVNEILDLCFSAKVAVRTTIDNKTGISANFANCQSKSVKSLECRRTALITDYFTQKRGNGDRILKWSIFTPAGDVAGAGTPRETADPHSHLVEKSAVHRSDAGPNYGLGLQSFAAHNFDRQVVECCTSAEAELSLAAARPPPSPPLNYYCEEEPSSGEYLDELTPPDSYVKDLSDLDDSEGIELSKLVCVGNEQSTADLRVDDGGVDLKNNINLVEYNKMADSVELNKEKAVVTPDQSTTVSRCKRNLEESFNNVSHSQPDKNESNELQAPIKKKQKTSLNTDMETEKTFSSPDETRSQDYNYNTPERDSGVENVPNPNLNGDQMRPENAVCGNLHHLPNDTSNSKKEFVDFGSFSSDRDDCKEAYSPSDESSKKATDNEESGDESPEYLAVPGSPDEEDMELYQLAMIPLTFDCNSDLVKKLMTNDSVNNNDSTSGANSLPEAALLGCSSNKKKACSSLNLSVEIEECYDESFYNDDFSKGKLLKEQITEKANEKEYNSGLVREKNNLQMRSIHYPSSVSLGSSSCVSRDSLADGLEDKEDYGLDSSTDAEKCGAILENPGTGSGRLFLLNRAPRVGLSRRQGVAALHLAKK